MKVLIYGAGEGGRHLYDEFQSSEEPYEILAFVDRRLGGTTVYDLPIIRPEEIPSYSFDRIFVATLDLRVKDVLRDEIGVPEEKINTSRFLHSTEIIVRVRALERVKDLFEMYDVPGAMAEVGVFQGDFAKHINRLFPERKLYLYDTFAGFSDDDLGKENSFVDVKSKFTHYANTTEQLVMGKMVHPEQVVIRKGLFPETFQEDRERFAFVNLDADLYAPTLAGLQYFWPRLSPGGVIFVHDFFAEKVWGGVRKAVTEFLQEGAIGITPLGDFRTIALAKPLKIEGRQQDA